MAASPPIAWAATARQCGLELNLPNCAHCADYGSCATIAEWLDHAPYLKPVFDEIRAAL
jgi:hypothetical protein